jgi:hypothetical protein
MPAIAQEMESSIVEQESYTRKQWKKSTVAMLIFATASLGRDELGHVIDPRSATNPPYRLAPVPLVASNQYLRL